MSGEENTELARTEGHEHPPSFSWLDPHPFFVVLLVGPEEQPFGIQKDFLCARSGFYQDYFNQAEESNTIEHIVKLPDTAPEVFGYVQHYLYTGQVFTDLEQLPSYEVLIGTWKTGLELRIDGLCDATLDAMAEVRRITQHIPATPLLVQVWQDTPEGSSIRTLLLSWAAEYMRSSESRTEFAKSLPQEVLSELVVVITLPDTSPVVQVVPPEPVSEHDQQMRSGPQPTQPPQAQAQHQAGVVHFLEEDQAEQGPSQKRQRKSDVLPRPSAPMVKPAVKKPGPKPINAGVKAPAKRRTTWSEVDSANYSTEQKLNFCSDLLTRMLSGPGFWTRLVGPFKEPVDPAQDGVPDYLEKITRPMDLTTMREKMDRGEYTSEEDFLVDMNQIFNNCYTYWSKKDPMWAACEKLQKSFEDKYSLMNRWISKMEGMEEH